MTADFETAAAASLAPPREEHQLSLATEACTCGYAVWSDGQFLGHRDQLQARALAAVPSINVPHEYRFVSEVRPADG